MGQAKRRLSAIVARAVTDGRELPHPLGLHKVVGWPGDLGPTAAAPRKTVAFEGVELDAKELARVRDKLRARAKNKPAFAAVLAEKARDLLRRITLRRVRRG